MSKVSLAYSKESLHALFSNHKLDANQKQRYDELSKKFIELVDVIADVCPYCEETDQAILRLKEASMWASTAISNHHQ